MLGSEARPNSFAPPSRDRLAINQITTKSWGLRDAIRGYSRHNVRSITVWRDKLAEVGASDAADMLGDHGMSVVALTPARVPVCVDVHVRPAMDDVLRAIDEAMEIGAETLLVLGSPPAFLPPPDVRQVLSERLNGLMERTPPELQLVIEPLHPISAATVSPLNTLRDALDICDQAPRLAVAVDVYNLWWDWELELQIARAGSRLRGFHVSDWLPGDTGGLRYNRGMMGDGCIDVRRIRQAMDAAGYVGAIEVEIFSQHDWWRRDPDQVVQTCIERFLRHC